MSVEDAYQRALNTLQKWVQKEVNTTKTLVVLRTYSPAHASMAGSNGGGGDGCGRETVPELNMSRIALHRWPGLLNPSPAFIEAAAAKKKKKRRRRQVMHVLNVTLMTAQRRDGHPSVYNVVRLPSPPAGVQQTQQEQVTMRAADCSHWCLPGVPDAWNELLYALILRRIASDRS